MDIEQYGVCLRSAGTKVVAGSQNTLWVGCGPFLNQILAGSQGADGGRSWPLVIQRRPYFALHVPPKEEIETVFRQSHIPLLNFAVSSPDAPVMLRSAYAPGPLWMSKSYLYICRDPDYSSEKLGQSARSHIRRSLGAFEFRFLDQVELLKLGFQAYCDKRARFGVSRSTPESFKAEFGRKEPLSRYIGALKDGRLAAFLVVTEVEDWASLGSSYSVDEALSFRPNNGLFYYTLHHYLVERKFRLVNDGMTNFPITPKVEELHRFKVKMGFEACPVHRAFVVNPLLRPLVNRVSWRLANGLLRLFPSNPIVRKAEFALAVALGIGSQYLA
jgi:hypothetical protein